MRRIQNDGGIRPGGWVAVLAAMFLGEGCLLLAAWEPRLPPATEILEPAETPVRVALLWSDPVDLDLYVTDPALETVYFANNPSGSGGELEKDVQCGDVSGKGSGVALLESVSWKGPAAGKYRVGVDYIDACASESEEISYRVVVDAGEERFEREGTARLERFEPVVIEFDVSEGTARQSKPDPSGSEAR